MSTTLTTEYIDKALGRLATKDDITRLEVNTKQNLKDGLAGLREDMRQDFSDLQSSVDRYLKRSETWHDELQVLQARYNQLVHILDEKGLVKEEETHLV